MLKITSNSVIFGHGDIEVREGDDGEIEIRYDPGEEYESDWEEPSCENNFWDACEAIVEMKEIIDQQSREIEAFEELVFEYQQECRRNR